jgi:hypothetical protein
VTGVQTCALPISHRDTSLKKYVDILLKAHPILYSEELQLFTYQNIFNSVNKLCKENNIKLINLMPFEHNYRSRGNQANNLDIDISDAIGPCLTGLCDVSHNEAIDEHGVFHLDMFKGLPHDNRASHLGTENNKILASIISEIFNLNQLGIIELQNDNRFLKGTLFNEN